MDTDTCRHTHTHREKALQRGQQRPSLRELVFKGEKQGGTWGIQNYRSELAWDFSTGGVSASEQDQLKSFQVIVPLPSFKVEH